MISTFHLGDVFVEVADSLVDDFDLIDFMHNLAEHAATICQAATVGVLLADQHDTLHFMAASSGAGKLMELFQLQNEEGPCLDCFRSQEPVVNSDLRAASERWPRFAPRALEEGFHSVHALPMRVRGQTIGTLNIFGDDDTRFAPGDVRVVQAIADVATIAILQERHLSEASALTEQLQGALNSRIVIEQAKGALSAMTGAGIDEAFTLLRSYARANRQRLVDVAHAVLTDPDTVPALTRPR